MKYQNATLSGDITLDGHEFIDCRFENARVRFDGGPCTFVNVTLGPNVAFGFFGPAMRTIQLLQFLRTNADNGAEVIQSLLVPERAPTVTQ